VPRRSARLYREILDRAQLERDVRVAARFQRAAPARAAAVNAARFDIGRAVDSLPRDWRRLLRYFEREDGATGLVIGDVSGKGAPAALLTAVLQGICRCTPTATTRPAPPCRRQRSARAAQHRRALRDDVLRVVWPDGRMRYCNAGHNPPIVLGTTPSRRLEIGGTIVGAFADARSRKRRCSSRAATRSSPSATGSPKR